MSTDKALVIKSSRIGASDVYIAAEMGEENEEILAINFILKLLSKRKAIETGVPIESKDNEFTKTGKEMEPLIFDFYKKNSPYEVEEQVTFYRKHEDDDYSDVDERDLVIARTDGLVKKSKKLRYPLELKCPSAQYESVPVKYYVQMQMQMYAMGPDVDRGHFLSVVCLDREEKILDFENKLLCVVYRDQEMIDEIMKRLMYIYTKFLFESAPEEKELGIKGRLFDKYPTSALKIKKTKDFSI